MKTWFLTSNSVFGESFQLVSCWKPIGKRPLEMSPVLVSWVGALAVFTVVELQLTCAGSPRSSRGKETRTEQQLLQRQAYRDMNEKPVLRGDAREPQTRSAVELDPTRNVSTVVISTSPCAREVVTHCIEKHLGTCGKATLPGPSATVSHGRRNVEPNSNCRCRNSWPLGRRNVEKKH